MNETGMHARRAEAMATICNHIRPEVPWFSPGEFQQRSQEDEWTIVDVRSPQERGVSIIPGALSREGFEAQVDEHAGRQILVYCTAGCRSGAYVTDLRQKGLNAFNLRGGVLGWALNGGPFVTADGHPTRRVHVHHHPWNVLPPGYEAVG